VVARLPEDVWVIAPDHRGQGSSDAAGIMPSITKLAEDTIALVDAVVGGPVHIVGSSMGGYVAMAVAQKRPELLLSCALSCCTASDEQDPHRFAALESALREQGPPALVDTLLSTMFGEHFLAHGDPLAIEYWRAHFLSLDRKIADAVHGVFSRPSFIPKLPAWPTSHCS
jgi:3-oxoadipate enol-lactonase